MRVIWAFLRANWLSAATYRVQHVYTIVGLLFGVIPLFFVARAIQGLAADAIRYEGGQYFAFVIVGMVAHSFITNAVNAVPGAVGGSIGSGTFDSLVTVPTPLPVIFAGMSAFGFSWTFLRALLMLAFGTALGANVQWEYLLVGIAILLLLVLAYLPFGLLSSALVVAFRTDGPLRPAISMASILLGGVFYPTSVIPSWLQKLSGLVPLSYGLRALRRVMLQGEPIPSVAGDLGALLLFAVVGVPVGLLAMRSAFTYARRAGTLTQY